MIDYINMVLTAFEVYKTENRTLNYNKTVKTVKTVMEMFSRTPQLGT